MGVKNHLWPLQLHDPALQGVNPRDPDLSDEMKQRVIIEVKNNFFYFIREVMIIPGSDAFETVQFRMNRGMGALYWLYFTHCVPYLVMIRQTGKSFGMDTLDIWLSNYRLYYAGLSLVTKNETLRASNMRRIKEIEETLPWYLKVRLPKDPANTEEYHVSLMKNILKAHLASASPKMAEGLGRGLTDQHTRFDELAYLFNIEISLPAALAAGAAARERARRRGDPYGTILATTAGKKDDRDGAYAYQEMMSAASWTESMMDSVNEEALHKLVATLAKSHSDTKIENLTVNASFIHTQLGYDELWLRRQIRDAKVSGDAAERDFGNVWTSGSMQSPLGTEIAGVIRASEIREPHIQIFDNYGYALRWTNSQDHAFSSIQDKPTVIGLDASDAIGRDDIGLVIEDVSTGGVVGAGDFNNLSLFDFSKWLADLMIANPKTTLVPEMRSSARAIVDYVTSRLIEAGENPFKRIYNNVVQNRQEKPNDFEAIRFYGLNSDVIIRFKREFGFTTSGSGTMARSVLYGRNLTSCASHCGRFTHDSRLINQILSLVIRNGRIDHAVGGHDDLCFVGSTLVRTNTGNRPISELRIGDLVLTRQGFKPILSIFCSEKEVITKFGLTGTANHPFITPIGEVPFSDLTPESEVYQWNEKQSHIKVRTIADILNQDAPSYKDTSNTTIKEQLVYNLMVADCHEYFVNDILVHNCVAWLLGHWFLTSAKNIDYYGIQSSLVLRYIDTGKEFKTPEDRYKVFINDRIRQELENLSVLMQKEKDQHLYQRLENRARMLIRSLRQEDLQTFSVSEFFEQIRLTREQNVARS